MIPDSRGKTYISWATEFDVYEGQKNWQDLSLAERTTIVRYELDYEPEQLDIEEFVMSTNLRRIQYDGLCTVIHRIGRALEEDGVSFVTNGKVRYHLVLPYMEKTALGQELISLYNGTADERTNYRMGELEFLAQSGSKSSPLDQLLELRPDYQLKGILELLKPKGAFDPAEHSPAGGSNNDRNLNQLPFFEAMQLVDSKKLRMYASYSGSLQAFAHGLVKIGPLGKFAGIAFMAAPVAGLVGALFVAWWWLLVGILAAIIAFRYSRNAATNAVLRQARTDEAFFEAMRKHQVIWLESITSV